MIQRAVFVCLAQEEGEAVLGRAGSARHSSNVQAGPVLGIFRIWQIRRQVTSCLNYDDLCTDGSTFSYSVTYQALIA